MSAKRFVDTNILVYAHDRQAGRKYTRARSIVEDLWQAEAGVISTQVLQELYATVTRKIERPLPSVQARQLVEDYRLWECIVNDADAILNAIELEKRYQISFWDALIVNAANDSEADVLLSEDLNSGQRYGSVIAENPLL